MPSFGGETCLQINAWFLVVEIPILLRNHALVLPVAYQSGGSLKTDILESLFLVISQVCHFSFYSVHHGVID